MKDGEIAGAFSVSMPKYRLTEENKTTINQALLATKQRLKRNYSRKRKTNKSRLGFLFVFLFTNKTFAFSFYLYNEVVNFFIINIYF